MPPPSQCVGSHCCTSVSEGGALPCRCLRVWGLSHYHMTYSGCKRPPCGTLSLHTTWEALRLQCMLLNMTIINKYIVVIKLRKGSKLTGKHDNVSFSNDWCFSNNTWPIQALLIISLFCFGLCCVAHTKQYLSDTLHSFRKEIQYSTTSLFLNMLLR